MIRLLSPTRSTRPLVAAFALTVWTAPSAFGGSFDTERAQLRQAERLGDTVAQRQLLKRHGPSDDRSSALPLYREPSSGLEPGTEKALRLRPGHYTLQQDHAARFRIEDVQALWVEISITHRDASLILASTGGSAPPLALRGHSEVRQVLAHDRFQPLELEVWSSEPGAEVRIRGVEAGLCARAEVDESARLLVEQAGSTSDLVPFASGRACAGVDTGQVKLTVLADVDSDALVPHTTTVDGSTLRTVTLQRGESREISGQVTSDSGSSPIAGAWVGAYDAATELLVRQTLADATGSYTLQALPPGSYHVLFETDSFVSELHDDVACLGGLDVGCALTDGTAVDVTAGNATLDASLTQAGQISGQITSSGQPVEGAVVLAYEASGTPVAFGFSDQNGDYVIDQLPDGVYAVLGTATGYDAVLWQGVSCAGGIPSDCSVEDATPVTASIGATTPGVDFDLPRRGSISGVVTDNSGTPLEASIEVFDAAGQFVATTTSDPIDGSYQLLGLDGGIYFARAFVRPSGSRPTEFYGEIFEGLECADWFCPNPSVGTPIEVAIGSDRPDVSFSLPRLSALIFKVTNPDGVALPFDARVQLYSEEGAWIQTRWADSEGQIRIDPLAPGTYFAIGSASGFRSVLYDGFICQETCNPVTGTPIAHVTDFDQNIAISLEPLSGSIEGTVRSVIDGSVAGGRVTVYDLQGNDVRTVYTVSGGAGFGSYSTGGLEPGLYRLYVDSSRSIDELHQGIACEGGPGVGCDLSDGALIAVGETGVTRVDFVLDRLPAIRAVATNESGEELDGAALYLYDSTGTLLQSSASSFDGNATFYLEEPEVPADFFVAADVEAHRSEVFEDLLCDPLPAGCAIPDGTPITKPAINETTEVVLRLSSLPRIHTALVDQQGSPVSGRVELHGPTGFISGSYTGSSYTFVVEPGGPYYLRASAERFRTQLFEELNCGPTTSCIPQDDGDPLHLSLDEQRSVTFTLDALPRIQGSIRDLSGELIPYSNLFFWDEAGNLAASRYEGGHYDVSVPPGTYTVSSQYSGYFAQIWPGIDCLDGPPPDSCDPTEGARIEVDLNQTVSDVDFHHSRLGRILGTLSTNPTTTDRQWIDLFNSKGERIEWFSTVPPFSFEFDRLHPGTYFVRARGNGFLSEVFDGSTCFGGKQLGCDPLLGSPLVVEPDSLITGVNFSLETGASLSGIIGPGDVFNPDNDNPKVDIWSGDGTRLATVESEVNSFSTRYEYDLSMPFEGSFYLTTDSRRWVNRAYPDLLCWGRFGEDCDPTVGTPVTTVIGEIASVNFPLAGAQNVSGTVLLDGAIPAANAIIRAWDTTGLTELNATITAADGTFEWSNTPDGDYRITASVPGYETIAWPDALCPAPCTTPGSIGSIVLPRQNLDPVVLEFSLPSLAEVFADGFESGDVTAWSSELP